ncbi:14985_t:CDS:2, partial [Acaulospora colombiana]
MNWHDTASRELRTHTALGTGVSRRTMESTKTLPTPCSHSFLLLQRASSDSDGGQPIWSESVRQRQSKAISQPATMQVRPNHINPLIKLCGNRGFRPKYKLGRYVPHSNDLSASSELEVAFETGIRESSKSGKSLEKANSQWF